jgi:predicted Zn-dependent protease
MARRPAALLVTAALLAACSTPGNTPGSVADLRPAERPVRGSDEAALWLVADRNEEELRSSPAILRNTPLQAYVHGVACRLAGPQCQDLRVYVGRDPEFGAWVAPNGTIRVTTGLLLRLANEAQLAYVLGHEIAHYRRRHALRRWGEILARSRDLAREVGVIAAFSREQEYEADQLGFDLMLQVGYDVREAPRAMERMRIDLREANRSTNAFLATHPASAERLARLREYAEHTGRPARAVVGAEEYRAQLRPFWRRLLHDEVRRREFADSERVLALLLAEAEDPGAVHFALGEVRRLRAAGSDLANAIASYREALEFVDAPPETYRGLGLIHARMRDRASAVEALTRYLERRPDAEDRALIESQLAELRGAP